MSEYGIQVSQEGTPLSRAADYQKIIDSREPTLDILFDGEVRFEKKSYTTNGTHYWVMELYQHDLGFCPAFSYRVKTPTLNESPFDPLEFIATKDRVYVMGFYFAGDPVLPIIGHIQLTIYACNIIKEYQAPIEDIGAATPARAARYGLKILRKGRETKGIASKDSGDFSVDTDAKALAIQQTGVLNLNPYVDYDKVQVDSIDTTADTIAFTKINATDDITWLSTMGNALTFRPVDTVTFPTGLTSSVYYIIPVNATTVKLANSYRNAQLGVAVDISSGLVVAAQLWGEENTSVPTNLITHNLGYPPIYMLSGYRTDADWPNSDARPLTDPWVNPLGYTGAFLVDVYIRATTTTLGLYGAQSTASGKYAYIILKDPLGGVA